MTYAAHADGFASDRLHELSRQDLQHIPGDEGWPLIGITLRLLADPKGQVEQMAKRYGPVYRSRAFGMRVITLLGPEANELVLFDRNKIFSSAEGWNPLLDRLFPRGLMLLDFDEHRLHRKALSSAFKIGPMKAYLSRLNDGIASAVAGWRAKGGDMLFYPAIKQLTLELAATSFFGRDLGADMEPLKRAFVDMVKAIVAVVGSPLPGTLMARGVKGRAFMVDYLTREIEARRASDGDDLFTELCKASMEDGRLLSPPEIVDHMSFLMMAAHDTLTSSLSSLVWLLSSNPRLANEAARGMPRTWPRPRRATALRAARRSPAYGNGVQGIAALVSAGSLATRAARCATPSSRASRSPRAPGYPSTRSIRTVCLMCGPTRRCSIRPGFRRRIRAAGTSSRSCRMAAARTCA